MPYVGSTVLITEGPRTRAVQPKMKCGKLSKYHKNEKVGYTLVRNMRFTEYSCPETQNKIVSSSKEVELMVCGTGSQPFNYWMLLQGSPHSHVAISRGSVFSRSLRPL